MTIKLYTVKANEGYIRFDQAGQCISVKLDRASVYDSPNDPELLVILEKAGQAGFTSLRLSELTLVERDYVKLNC